MRSIIVAMDRNNAIGFGNDLPWGNSLKDDLAHFRQSTKGGSIIMGRRTFESMGSKPLPDRENIVVSRNPTGVKGVLSALSLEAAYALSRYPVYVIGGGQIYTQAIDDMDQLIVTHVDAQFEKADVYFPAIDSEQWEETERQHFEKSDRNQHPFDIVYYRKTDRS